MDAQVLRPCPESVLTFQVKNQGVGPFFDSLMFATAVRKFNSSGDRWLLMRPAKQPEVLMFIWI